jgi:nitrite reductase/ring-hydroxylating ferredoxin subunit
MSGPLAEGKIEGNAIRCPWHGSCFSLEDGSVLEGPATNPQPSFEVRIADGQIYLRSREPESP